MRIALACPCATNMLATTAKQTLVLFFRQHKEQRACVRSVFSQESLLVSLLRRLVPKLTEQ